MKVFGKYKSLVKGAVFFLSCCFIFNGCQSEKTSPVKSFYGLTDYDGKSSTGSYSPSSYLRTGRTYTFTAKDVNSQNFQSKIDSLKSGDTIILDGSEGTFFLTTTYIRRSGITIKGVNVAVLDFSETLSGVSQEEIDSAVEKVRANFLKGESHFLSYCDNELDSRLNKGRGFYVTGEYNIFENLIIENASDNGLLISQGGNFNIVKNCEARFCGDSGFEVAGIRIDGVDCSEDYKEEGPHDNKFFDCYSHNNFDPWNLGENADGFAVKGGAGDFNYFENCTARWNSDDGWDCYRIRGSTTWINCRAEYNGLCQATGKDWAECSNGNGFKVGGGDRNGTFKGQKVNCPEKHPHAQYLKGCSARGNRGNSGVGFDRNNQYGSIYLVDCHGEDNHADILISGKSTYRHEDYAFGSYGAPCYVKNCTTGSPDGKVSGSYEGDRIVAR